MTKELHYFREIHFLFGKTEMKYEISVSKLTLHQILPLKVEKLVKSLTLTPKTKNDVIIGNQ